MEIEIEILVMLLRWCVYLKEEEDRKKDMRSHHVTHAYKHVKHCTLSSCSVSLVRLVTKICSKHSIFSKIELKMWQSHHLSRKYANSIKAKRQTHPCIYTWNKCTCHLISLEQPCGNLLGKDRRATHTKTNAKKIHKMKRKRSKHTKPTSLSINWIVLCNWLIKMNI